MWIIPFSSHFFHLLSWAAACLSKDTRRKSNPPEPSVAQITKQSCTVYTFSPSILPSGHAILNYTRSVSNTRTQTHKEMSVCNPPRSTELYIHGNSFNSRCVIHKQDNICGFTALYTEPPEQQGQFSTEAPWHSSFRDSLWNLAQGQRSWKSLWIKAWQWKCTWSWKSAGMDMYIPDLRHAKMLTHSDIYILLRLNNHTLPSRAGLWHPANCCGGKPARHRSQTGLVKKSRSQELFV